MRLRVFWDRDRGGSVQVANIGEIAQKLPNKYILLEGEVKFGLSQRGERGDYTKLKSDFQKLSKTWVKFSKNCPTNKFHWNGSWVSSFFFFFKRG